MWTVAAVLVLFGAALLLLALIMLLRAGEPWDLNGLVLDGGRVVLFALAMALLGAAALLCVAGLIRARRWARPLALLFWVLGPAIVLTFDRASSAPRFPVLAYTGTRMLLPLALTAALLYLLPSARDYFRDQPDR